MYKNRHEEYLQKLPIDWDKIAIKELGNIYSGGTPSRDDSSFWNGSIAWVTPSELTNLDGKWLTKTREYITANGLANSSAHLMPVGTLLVTTRATIGSIAIAEIPLCTNQGFKSIVPNNFTDSIFYYYLIQIVAPELSRLASGSTFDEISKRDFEAIVVPCPLFAEQQKIAEILDTIDEAISQTEKMISKLKQIKAGMLHDLLTCGLDENGKLRDPVAHPEQFKDSGIEAIGLIPKDWNVFKLGDCCSLLKDGTHLPPKRVESGVLLLGVQNMIQGDLMLTESDTRVSWNFYKSMHKNWKIQVGDVLLAIVGATIGKTALVPVMQPFTLQRSVAIFRGKANTLENSFLRLYLASENFQRNIWNRVNQTAQPGIYLAELSNMSVLLPNPKEQKLIAFTIELQDERIQKEEASRDKLKQQKQGLMHDLLTGKVRVKLDDK